MADTSTITIRRYYASFKSVWGILASAFGALPILSILLPEKAYPFPPIGDIEVPARAGLVVLAFAATFGVYFWAFSFHRRIPGVMAVVFGVSLVSLVVYLGLCERFVRRVDIPSRQTDVTVSVGYERTAFAEITFGAASDWELLRARGTDEEQIKKLWAMKSLIIARLALFATYSVFLLALVVMFSFGVVRDIYDRGEKTEEKSPAQSTVDAVTEKVQK